MMYYCHRSLSSRLVSIELHGRDSTLVCCLLVPSCLLLWWVGDSNVESKTLAINWEGGGNDEVYPPEPIPTQRPIKTGRDNRGRSLVSRNESWPFVRPVVTRMRAPSLWVEYRGIPDKTAVEPSHLWSCLWRHDLALSRNGAVSICAVSPSSMADLVSSNTSQANIVRHPLSQLLFTMS